MAKLWGIPKVRISSGMTLESDHVFLFAFVEVETPSKPEDKQPSKAEVVDNKQKEQAPKFTTALSDIEIEDGQSVTLSVEVDGFPTPSIKWFIDDEEIIEGDGIALTQDGNKHSLKIQEAILEDDGEYICVAENSVGESSCTAMLCVKERIKKPDFVQKLKDVEINEDGNAEFVAKVTGSPNPDIKWVKDKTPLQNSEKFVISEMEDKYLLTVLKCNLDDAGKYEVTANNKGGKISSVAKLIVKETPKPPVIEHSSDVPQEYKISEGGVIHLEVLVKAKQPIETSWEWNGKRIRKNKRIEMRELKGVFSLDIADVNSDDSGVYKFVAKNKAGSHEFEFKVDIERKSFK